MCLSEWLQLYNICYSASVCASLSLLIIKYKINHLFIKLSQKLLLPLDICSKCSHFWYTALFKENNNSREKSLLGKQRSRGLLSTTFSTDCYTSAVLMFQSTHFCRHTHTRTSQLKPGESFQNHSASNLFWRGTTTIRTLRILPKKTRQQDLFVYAFESLCYTLTLVNQVESSRAWLAFGGEADQDLVGGC